MILFVPIEPEKGEPASSEAELEKARKMMQRRRVVVKDTVRFEGGEVDLMVWDGQKPDGDVITLIFNGQILLDKYNGNLFL